MVQYLLATLNNSTELGTVANIELQSMSRVDVLKGQDNKMEEILGAPLPPAALPWKDYRGEPRLVVMNPRSSSAKGESLILNIIVLDRQPVKFVTVQHRRMGHNIWKTIEAQHVARAVWKATLPPAYDDYEYRVIAKTMKGAKLFWPATVPDINHTVIVNE
jgi:hypothetical protein